MHALGNNGSDSGKNGLSANRLLSFRSSDQEPDILRGAATEIGALVPLQLRKKVDPLAQCSSLLEINRNPQEVSGLLREVLFEVKGDLIDIRFKRRCGRDDGSDRLGSYLVVEVPEFLALVCRLTRVHFERKTVRVEKMRICEVRAYAAGGFQLNAVENGHAGNVAQILPGRSAEMKWENPGGRDGERGRRAAGLQPDVDWG